MSPQRIGQDLDRRSATPDEYLKQLQKITEQLNRWPVGATKRMELLEWLAKQFYTFAAPMFADLVRAYGGIPESPERRETFELHEHCTSALIDGYCILFAADYGRRSIFYRPVRARVYRCACRIMELTKLRQRIIGARYLRLEPRAWRTAHTVYAAMRACEPDDVVLDTLSQRNQSLDTSTQASLRQHYASLISYGALDYVAWPEQDQIAIDTYVRAVADAIRIQDFDPRLDPRPWYLYTHCYSEDPPTQQPPDDAQTDRIIMFDHRGLAASIRDDVKRLDIAIASRDNFKLPPRLTRIPEHRRIAFSFLLKRNLRVADDWSEDEDEPAEHRDLRIYTGFDEVRAHLLALFRRDDGRIRKMRELSDLFAQHSAVIGEDEKAPQRSLWYVLRDNQNTMRIKTQETRFTNRMYVGNLIAYGFGEEEVRTPRIGKVNRIFRPEAGTVLLDIEYLAAFGTPVRVYAVEPIQSDLGSASDETLVPVTESELSSEPLAAILIKHEQHGWGVVTPPQDQLWQGAMICIQTGNRLTRARLGEAGDVTAEFCRFTVTSAAFPSNQPHYPKVAESKDTRTVNAETALG
jgi:hypothetical protein